MAVYKRGENYYVDFTFKGRRIRESIGPSKKGAQDVINKKKVEIAENKFLDVKREPDPIKFHDFAREYLKWGKANKKHSTHYRDLSLMRHLDAEFGEKALHDITTWAIEKYKARRKDSVKRPGAVKGIFRVKGEGGQEKTAWFVEYCRPNGRKVKRNFGDDQLAMEAFFARSNEPIMPATVNREMALLKHMYSRAIEWGKVKENPAKKVKLLKGEVKRVRFLLPGEIQKLLACCAPSIKPIVSLVLNTGLRAGEVFGLTWKQINFETGIISILDSKNHERRDLSMNQTARAVLEGLDRLKEHVFHSESGKPFGRVPKAFHEAIKKAGISDFRFHDLRHTFASNLVMQGIDIMTVKELLGHKTLEMTQRYSHLAPEHKTRAVNILDRLLSPQENDLSQNPPQAPEGMPRALSIRH